jgi:hypothetical protein
MLVLIRHIGKARVKCNSVISSGRNWKKSVIMEVNHGNIFLVWVRRQIFVSLS